MSDAEKVTDHDTIRSWAEERGGEPAAVADTLEDGQDGAVLRLKFARDGSGDDDLEVIEWDRFFEIFDENQLAALLQDETKDGSPSRFVKFVSR